MKLQVVISVALVIIGGATMYLTTDDEAAGIGFLAAVLGVGIYCLPAEFFRKMFEKEEQ